MFDQRQFTRFLFTLPMFSMKDWIEISRALFYTTSKSVQLMRPLTREEFSHFVSSLDKFKEDDYWFHKYARLNRNIPRVIQKTPEESDFYQQYINAGGLDEYACFKVDFEDKTEVDESVHKIDDPFTDEPRMYAQLQTKSLDSNWLHRQKASRMG